MSKYRVAKTVAMLQGLGLGLGLSCVSMAATYDIEPSHANVRFAIDHFHTSTNTGGFYNLTGKVVYNPKLEEGSVSLIIPIDSINTGNSEFDDHLKGSDFFDVANYPTAKFESTQWHFNPNAITNPLEAFDNDDNDESDESDNTGLAVTQVDGLLTLRGETHPITLKATKFNCYFSPIVTKQVCGGDFTTTIDRTKWGIDKYVLMGMSKEVTLNIQIEANRR